MVKIRLSLIRQMLIDKIQVVALLVGLMVERAILLKFAMDMVIELLLMQLLIQRIAKL